MCVVLIDGVPASPDSVTGSAGAHTRTEPHWERLVEGVLTDPTRLELVFQPIVSLQEALVVGYEALSRFHGPPELSPDQWFAAADRQGRGAELEAVVVARCLALRTSLPPDCGGATRDQTGMLVASNRSCRQPWHRLVQAVSRPDRVTAPTSPNVPDG